MKKKIQLFFATVSRRKNKAAGTHTITIINQNATKSACKEALASSRPVIDADSHVLESVEYRRNELSARNAKFQTSKNHLLKTIWRKRILIVLLVSGFLVYAITLLQIHIAIKTAKVLTTACMTLIMLKSLVISFLPFCILDFIEQNVKTIHAEAMNTNNKKG